MHIKACGQGLKLLDHEEIHVMNIDPSLLEKLNIKEHEDSIEIGVTTIVPAHLMGSGLGSATTMLGDYDICLLYTSKFLHIDPKAIYISCFFFTCCGGIWLMIIYDHCRIFISGISLYGFLRYFRIIGYCYLFSLSLIHI